MDISKFRRSINVDDDQLNPFWEDYNKSFLATLIGPKQPPLRQASMYPFPPIPKQSPSQMATDAGWEDVAANKLIDDGE